MTAALVFVSLSYRGGDLSDLAHAVESWSHRPTIAFVQAVRARSMMILPPPEVIAAAQRDRHAHFDLPGPEFKPLATIRPFEMDLSAVGDGKDFTRLLRAKTQTESTAGGSGIALWDAAWQPDTTFVQMRRIPLPDGWKESTKPPLLSGGRLTLELPEKEAIKAESLTKLAWSKPVKIHWLLKQFWVVPCLHGASEPSTLDTLARAISGKLVDAGTEWRIEFDPVEFRKRALASVDRATINESADVTKIGTKGDMARREGEFQRSLRHLNHQVWQYLDEKDVAELFRESNIGIYRKYPNGTPVQRAVEAYRLAYESFYANDSTAPRSEVEAKRELISRIDPDGSVGVVVGQNLGTCVACARVGGGTILLN